MSFKHLSVAQLRQLLLSDISVTMIDIRDEGSFASGNIPGSVSLIEFGVDTFVREASKSLPLVVVCYHGNSSQSAAKYMVEQGFTEVYSLDGGYTAWAAEPDPTI